MNVVEETADNGITSEFIEVETNPLIEIKCEIEEQTVNVKIEREYDEYTNLESSLNHNEVISFTEVQTVTSEPDLDQDIFDNIKIEEVKVELLQEIDEQTTPYFFDQLFDSKSIPGLTEYWGIHSCEPKSSPVRPCMVLIAEPKQPKCVVFSQVDIRQGVPIFGKQVVANDHLEIRYFAGNRELSGALPQTYTSLEELSRAINLFARYKLCPGSVNSDDYEECECATNSLYRDCTSKTWRHRYCNVFIHEGMQVCPYCQGVPSYLRNLSKNSKTLKRKRAYEALAREVAASTHGKCKRKHVDSAIDCMSKTATQKTKKICLSNFLL